MQEEVYGTRRRDYSAWHRRLSTGRYIGIERAQLLAMIDLDASLYVEYDDKTKEPLALIETAQDVGQNTKPATVTAKLARRANLPAYTMLYALSDSQNPADRMWKDIESFRVKRLHPPPVTGWMILTPKEWADALLALRDTQAAVLDIELFGIPEEIPF